MIFLNSLNKCCKTMLVISTLDFINKSSFHFQNIREIWKFDVETPKWWCDKYSPNENQNNQWSIKRFFCKCLINISCHFFPRISRIQQVNPNFFIYVKRNDGWKSPAVCLLNLWSVGHYCSQKFVLVVFLVLTNWRRKTDWKNNNTLKTFSLFSCFKICITKNTYAAFDGLSVHIHFVLNCTSENDLIKLNKRHQHEDCGEYCLFVICFY